MQDYKHDFIYAINKAGGEVYVVGGHVRNVAYNIIHNTKISIKDSDFLVRLLDIESLIKILKHYGKIKEVGKSFGIILLTPYHPYNGINGGVDNNVSIEIALPRKEISTGPKYKDFIISADPFLSLEEDFSRRDATINAMAYKLNTLSDLTSDMYLENIIDPFNGLSDIKNKMWTAIGDPKKRFYEDPTRIMRAFRQSAELNISINNDTLNAIKENYHLLDILVPQSYVRLFNELFKMIQSPFFEPFLNIMYDIGILKLLGFTNKLEHIHEIMDTNNVRLKIALLLSQNFTDNVKKWGSDRQITATNYIDKHDLNFFECIEKYLSNLKIVGTKYDLLKLINKVEKTYQHHGLEFVCDMIKYYYLIAYEVNNLFDIFEKCKSYPTSIDFIKLSGKICIDKWNITGVKIQILKEKILDSIYSDQLKNIENDLIHYVETKYLLSN